MLIADVGWGIDFVRLREGLAPPHWTRRAGGGWDAGYETTAYFLHWIDDTWGAGTVRALNARLDAAKYDAGIFADVTGVSVDELWATYVDTLEGRRLLHSNRGLRPGQRQRGGGRKGRLGQSE